MGLIDLTGQQFGRLTVLYRDKEAEKLKKDRHAMWRCQCECGNLTSVVGRDLRRNATLSCGCLQKERTSKANGVNFIGKTFGKLTVLQQAPSKNQRTYWVCRCECGNETVKCTRELSRGEANSCGCLYSKGEMKIQSILNSLELKYEKEFSFLDLRSPACIPYRFDFAIFNNEQLQCLIEYDGIQHFETGHGWNDADSLKRNIQTDKIKNEYCQQNNIPLIRIPYTDYNKITQEYLLERIEKECQFTVDTL